MSAISRRALLATAGVSLLGGGLEAASLAGVFDHRDRLAPSAAERTRAALAQRGNGIIHVGHSTHIVEVDGVRVLTDPWFGDPAFGALAHSDGPACDVDALAGVHAVVISHEHPDHADLGALDRFASKARVLALAEHVLTATSTSAGAALFARELTRLFPGVRCAQPKPGDRVSV